MKTNIIFLIICRSVPLRMRKISDKSCGENQNTNFMFNNACSKIVPFMRKRVKILYGPAGHRWQYGATAFHAGYVRLRSHTHTEYSILTAVPATMFTRMHHNVTYTYFAYLVLSLHHQNNRSKNIYVSVCPSSNRQPKKLIIGRKIFEGHLSSPLHPPSYTYWETPVHLTFVTGKDLRNTILKFRKVTFMLTSRINVSLNQEIGQGDTTFSSFEIASFHSLRRIRN